MKLYKIGSIGKILKGDDVGKFIKIIDDSSDTGGYLIILSKDITFCEAYDDWVEDVDMLNIYFLQSEWEIQWLDS